MTDQPETGTIDVRRNRQTAEAVNHLDHLLDAERGGPGEQSEA